VGMFEHVGEARLPEYFLRAHRLLRPGGVFLNHGISSNPITPVRRGPTFVSRYVFPDGELVPIATTIGAAEGCGFEVRDVESLREHYALTLGHWVRRLEARSDEARRITDETTYRVWRLYMSGSAHGFRTGVGSTSTRHCSPNPNAARAGCRSRGPTGTPDLTAIRSAEDLARWHRPNVRNFYPDGFIWRSRKSST
jgi:cyclopropane fatty-acyl-phospholipid synthase-like methyltransferase